MRYGVTDVGKQIKAMRHFDRIMRQADFIIAVRTFHIRLFPAANFVIESVRQRQIFYMIAERISEGRQSPDPVVIGVLVITVLDAKFRLGRRVNEFDIAFDALFGVGVKIGFGAQKFAQRFIDALLYPCAVGF